MKRHGISSSTLESNASFVMAGRISFVDGYKRTLTDGEKTTMA
jgi:hypothetical protein